MKGKKVPKNLVFIEACILIEKELKLNLLIMDLFIINLK